MKRKTIFALTAALCLGSSMTALAAPEIMPDGAAFDAEYYAQNNPDVTAALGTDTQALYQHYTTFGKGEGRLPYAPGTQLSDLPQAAETPDEESIPIKGIQGAFGAEYKLPTWCYYEAYGDKDNADGVKMMTVYTTVDSDFLDDDLKQLAQYTVPGYEWRPIQVVLGGEFNDEGRWWPGYNYEFLAQYSDNWVRVENLDDIFMYQFKVTLDGKDYTECRFASTGDRQVGEVHSERSSYFLVPEHYNGKLLFIIKAAKSPAEGSVADEENAVTYIF